ncbi:glycosyltransferase family 77 protein [Micromonas commoda]|uniref:Glycosyltransferase family 77 protein n=1 Tax=Micromonas commoda (strain RCC299 / NOUM17 / CCMP2709) TaxID=296587 RepID=C1EC48_MICCC|nr:glycosyltransferase family 77 protein [Micromonas commoda]ACO65837.1 glycosyltransferase family 77 protein [Micromonas commoda]|eukprot:XP_002504579.1 glycosyltransferase family 77 protein [Micromonas commoda]
MARRRLSRVKVPLRLVLPLVLLHAVLRANDLSLLHPEHWFAWSVAADAVGVESHRESRSAPTLPDPQELKARWMAELKPPKGAGIDIGSASKASSWKGFDGSLTSGEGDSLDARIQKERAVTDDEEEEFEGDDPELVIPDPMPVLAHKVAKPETPSAFAALGKFAVGDTVSACFATIEMLDFLVNWLEHASRLEMRNVLVIAMDKHTARWCDENGVARMDASDAIDKSEMNDPRVEVADVGYRMTRGFNLLGEAKTASIAKLLDMGLDVFLSDVDVVWLRNPSDYFESGQLALADVAVTSDCVFGSERRRPGWRDEFGQDPEPTRASANTGVTLFRSNPRAKAFVAAWRRRQRRTRETEPQHNDQQHFQFTLARSHGFEADTEVLKFDNQAPDGKSDKEMFVDDWIRGFRPRYYYAHVGIDGDEETVETKVKVALLPTNLFPNGHLHFVAHHAAKQGFADEVYAVHGTHNYGGSPGKLGRFREHGMWAVDGEEYYFGDLKQKAPKYLKVRFTVPEYLADPTPNLAVGKGERPERHLNLLQWQIERVRDGLALANITGRTLILPPMLCTCDRWWYLFQNCTNGVVTLPFVCPNDHVYLEPLMRKPEKMLRYREHTFLRQRREFAKRASDPRRLEERAIRSVARLTFCEDGDGEGRCAPTPVEGIMTTLPGYVPDPETDSLLDAIAGDPGKDVTVAYGSLAKHVMNALEGNEDADMLVVDGLGRGLNEGWDEGVTPFGGFDTQYMNQVFHKVTEWITESWCCYFHSMEDRGTEEKGAGCQG